MGTTYSYLNKELTMKYKIIIINETILCQLILLKVH